MGVMGCCRKGCEEIMCDTYVLNVGYICRECQLEFEQHLDSQGKFVLHEPVMLIELIKFIGVGKLSFEMDDPMGVEEFFRKYDV